VDNAYYGISPVTVRDLAPGTHVILLKEQGYTDWSSTVTVIPGTTISLAGSLSPAASPTHTPAPLAGILAGLGAAVIATGIRARRGKS